MSTHRTKLKVLATGEMIDTELHDSLSLDDLLDSQALWAPGKIGIAKECLRRGIERRLWPQSLHWNWADKASALKPYAPGPLSVFRLFGMKAQDKWQGTLLACCAGHHARTGSPGRDLVYIDFVETAPWNWDLPAIEQKPLLRGIDPVGNAAFCGKVGCALSLPCGVSGTYCGTQVRVTPYVLSAPIITLFLSTPVLPRRKPGFFTAAAALHRKSFRRHCLSAKPADKCPADRRRR